jgi:hypothetical protein
MNFSAIRMASKYWPLLTHRSMSDMHAALDSSNAESTLAPVFSFLEKDFEFPLTSKYDRPAVPSVFAFPSKTHVSLSALPPHKQIRLSQVVPQLDSSVGGKQP